MSVLLLFLLLIACLFFDLDRMSRFSTAYNDAITSIRRMRGGNTPFMMGTRFEAGANCLKRKGGKNKSSLPKKPKPLRSLIIPLPYHLMKTVYFLYLLHALFPLFYRQDTMSMKSSRRKLIMDAKTMVVLASCSHFE